MEANSILSAHLLDILFENRNKEYGAYQLRKTYNKRIIKAIAGMFLFCLLLIVVNIFADSKGTTTTPLIIGPDVIISDVDKPHEEIKPPPVKPQVKQVATRRVTIPRIVANDDVKPEDKPPINDELDNVKIGLENKDGMNGDIVQAPIEQGTGATELKTNKKDFEDKFTPVQIEAKFPGGQDAWLNYLERNLRTEIPVDNGAPAGKYTVVVSFLVDKDGNISEVQSLNDPGYGTAEEAIRVIKKSKQWSPAQQNGQPVIYHQKQSITFEVLEQ